MARVLGLKVEQLPDGEGAAMEQITFTTHTVTISTRRGTTPAPRTAASRP